MIIAEVGLAHDGSLGVAHSYVDAVARAGADAIKFQTHIAQAESTAQEPWRRPFAVEDARRYDYWERTGFTESQWRDLRLHAEQARLMFLSSPFSCEAVELLTRVGIGAWKIPSGELANPLLFEKVLETGLPIIASTGFGTWDEIDRVVLRAKAAGADLTLLQCTSMYPTPPDKIGLNVLDEYRDRYGCRVGLSDHSGSIVPGLAAVARGADVLEVHVTFSREMFGPDGAASLTFPELSQLVSGVRMIESVIASPVRKNEMASELGPVKQVFAKSIVAVQSLPVGTVLTAGHLTVKKPGIGIPAARFEEVVGRRLLRAVEADQFLAPSDFE